MFRRRRAKMDPQMITLVIGVSLLSFAGAVFAWAYATRHRTDNRSYR